MAGVHVINNQTFAFSSAMAEVIHAGQERIFGSYTFDSLAEPA